MSSTKVEEGLETRPRNRTRYLSLDPRGEGLTDPVRIRESLERMIERGRLDNHYPIKLG